MSESTPADAPATKGDIEALRALIETRLTPAPASTPGTDITRVRGDAAAAKYCGYATRRAFIAFTVRHRIFPIQEGRTKFWPVRDLDRAKRGKPENPAVWRAGKGGGR